MAAGFFAINYLDALADVEDDVEEAEEMNDERIVQRRLRDAMNPFELQERKFRKYFRLSRELARDLCDWLRPTLQRQRQHGLSVEKQVLTAVRFYATGSTQGTIGRDCSLTVSQPVVSRCIKDVSNAINRLLLRDCVKFPTSAEERRRAKEEFANAPQPFIGAIGAIDCTHVAIIAPSDHEENYLNHHQYHSMNVQVVSDAKYQILQICARFGGARHDAYLWNISPVRANMVENYENGERNTCLIGDSGYPLEPWLLTPIPDAEPGTPEFLYTTYHCKARSIVERCFGILKGVWICLSRRRVLWYGPVAAGRIINACAVLHNLRLRYNLAMDEDEIEEIHEDDDVRAREVEEYEADEGIDEPEGLVQQGIAPEGRARLNLARQVRAEYIQRYFA